MFGDVPVRVRRLLVCPCQDVIEGGAKSFAALDLGGDAVAPELAYVTARYAALLPFGKVATLLSELLPIGGAQNTGTVRNRTLRVGQDVVHQHLSETAERPVVQAGSPVVVGLDGGYVRSLHRQEERHFEVVAGKVIRADFDRVRGKCSGRDRGQAHEQEAADALEPGHGAALPRRAHRRAEQHARGCLPPSSPGLPARQR